jgi:oligoendopeptidase F
MASAAASARSVPEIREAVALFESWERSINDLHAAKGFTEAVQILDDYLECEPDTPHRSFIQNLRLSNTRRLLQQLARLDKKDFSLWLEYALAALSAVDKEAQSVMTANPDLKKDLDSFKHVWGDVLAQALKRVQNGEG